MRTRRPGGGRVKGRKHRGMKTAKQAAYSLGELAKMTGLSKARVDRVLASNGVEYDQVGAQNKRIVYVAELERKVPDLVDSVRFRGDDEE
jgi:hypothetical protein